MPTLIKWFGKACAAILKGYAKAASALGSPSQSAGADLWAQKVQSFTQSLYEKGHHAIQSLFRGFVKAFMIAAAATEGMAQLETMKAYLETSEGQKTVEDAANALELAVTVVLAILSGAGAYHGIKTSFDAIAGAETVFTAVKASHIIEAIQAAAAIAGGTVAKGAAEAGVTTALVAKIKENWSQVVDLLKRLADGVKDLFKGDDGAAEATA